MKLCQFGAMVARGIVKQPTERRPNSEMDIWRVNVLTHPRVRVSPGTITQQSSQSVAAPYLYEWVTSQTVLQPLWGGSAVASQGYIGRSRQYSTGVNLENAQDVSRIPEGLSPRRCCSSWSNAPGCFFVGTTPLQKSSMAIEALAEEVVSEPLSRTEEEQYENESVAREAVINYLRSESIDTAELEDVALPPSVTIIRERLIFLKKIGLKTKDINGYPLMVGCSVKKNLVPVLSYLEKLGIESRFLPELIRKYPMVLSCSVVMDLEPVVRFLLGIGIEKANLGRVLTRFPDILGFKIEGTMSTSVAYLVSLGVHMKDIGSMITTYPEILGMRVGQTIKPKVDFLLALGIPEEVLARILEVKPFILGFDLENKMKPAIKSLRDLGVRENSVAGILVEYADVLGLNVKQRLETKMGWLRKNAGVKDEDIGKVLEKLPQILAINISLAQSRVTFLRNGGFSVEDIGIMVTKCPQILALSIDEVLKPNLEFLVKNMKRPLAELVNYPSYFTYNLDKRIRPRYKQSEQKGICCSLSWLLNCSDTKFAENLKLDFVDRPGKEDVELLISMGGRLKV